MRNGEGVGAGLWVIEIANSGVDINRDGLVDVACGALFEGIRRV